MKKQHLQPSRLLLWIHVVSVIGFCITLFLRTAPESKHEKKGTKTKPTCDSTTSRTGRSVSIIVPARNEGRNIRRCITSLLEQDYDDYEVIVVDDGSTDATATILDEIAQSHPHGDRLWVLHLRSLPEGWVGKTHALHIGVQEATGDWLLFTDADTWHAPDALRSSITRAINEDIDLFSLAADQDLPDFWNRVMMPLAYIGISMQYPLKQVNDPASPVALANGQYLLIRRAVYDTTGGYARPELRGTLLDDLDLAIVVKRSGFRLRLEDGRDLVHTHMYEGLSEIWHGWRKNAYLGSRGGLPFMLLMLIGLPMMMIVPFLLPLSGWFIKDKKGISSTEWKLATVLELVPLLTYRVLVNRWFRVPWYYAFTHPLGSALFEGIMAQSAWRVLMRKGVDWRGRKYYEGR